MTEDEKKKTANLEDVQAFGRIIHNKGIGSEGTCSTAAATATKTVTVGTTFKPVAGATLIVTFQNAITVANATLAVTYGASGSQQTLAAKPIYYRGSALAANLVEAGATLVLRYDGTNYNIIGSLQIDPFPSQSGNNGKFLKTNGSAVSWADIPSDNTKTDKLPMTGTGAATENNFMAIDANGNIKDSGKNASDFQLKVTDCAMLGGGYVTCSTAGGTAAKTVTISNFLLLPNCRISVLFTNAFKSINPTLSINSGAAISIMYLNSVLAPEKVGRNTIVTMVYDGTYWQVIGIENPADVQNDFVDLDLPSGIMWAKCNIGATNPENDGFYFSYGNIVGHSWGSGYVFSTANYSSTTGGSLTSSYSSGDATYDAARAILGAPYRVPTRSELEELIAGTNREWVTNYVQGVNGMMFISKIHSDRYIFVPATGYWQDSNRGQVGENSRMWTSYFMITLSSNSSSCATDSMPLSTGFSIRPVF